MTEEQAVEFSKTHPTVQQARPEWKFNGYFNQLGKEYPVTAVVCQRNTKELIQLLLESLLRFYPDLNIVVVDDNSNDDSLLYLQFMELKHPNIRVWYRNDGTYIGHGCQLHETMINYVETEYALILDSDVIIDRGGFLEEMIERFSKNPKLFAIGTLQYTSYANNGGEPNTPEDAIPYGNPQLCLYHIPTYKELDAPFLTDGTPCILTAKAAYDAGLETEYYPTDKYSSHLGAGSWKNPRSVWNNDHDVYMRPFLTIIIDTLKPISVNQTDPDYNFVAIGEKREPIKNLPRHPLMTDYEPQEVTYKLYNIRFNVQGEYVLDCSNMESVRLPSDFIFQLKLKVIEEKLPDEIEVYGFNIFKRQHWQTQIK